MHDHCETEKVTMSFRGSASFRLVQGGASPSLPPPTGDCAIAQAATNNPRAAPHTLAVPVAHNPNQLFVLMLPLRACENPSQGNRTHALGLEGFQLVASAGLDIQNMLMGLASLPLPKVHFFHRETAPAFRFNLLIGFISTASSTGRFVNPAQDAAGGHCRGCRSSQRSARTREACRHRDRSAQSGSA